MDCSDISALSPLYFSGELDAGQAAAFAAHLASCPACASEIQRQTEADAKLRASVLSEPVDSAAIDRRVREQIGTSSGARRWLIPAAAALVALIVGYRIYEQRSIPKLCADAALDHRLEVVKGQRRPWIVDPAALGTLAAGQGLPENVPAVLANSGYRLERGKLCRLDGRAFLHLIYTDGKGEYSVFLRHESAGSLRSADVGEEHVAALSSAHGTTVIAVGPEILAALAARAL